MFTRRKKKSELKTEPVRERMYRRHMHEETRGLGQKAPNYLLKLHLTFVRLYIYAF
jgi:hypothetical protein